jgi:aryl-alcohol dehydrogenase-like predicted oxidoreductase
MRYKLFGRSGLRVSELCLGAMTFGTSWGWGSDRDESRAVFDAFAEAGGTFIDTAYIYTEGESERMLGDFVRSDRGHFVLSTKYGTMNKPDVTVTGGSRKAMRHAVDESLRRLGTDYIDLYWLHAWDPRTPVDELMRGLDDLVSAGKVLYVGVSNVPAWQVARCNTLADLHGWSPFVGLQTEYNLLERTAERELLPMAEELDLAVTAWSPLASGVLSGKYDQGATASGRRSDRPLSEREAKVAALVNEIAREVGAPTSAVAIAALRLLRPEALIIPLLGARTVDQLRENMACLDVALSKEQLAKIDEATAVSLGSPHEMLDTDYMRQVITGDAYDRLERRG